MARNAQGEQNDALPDTTVTDGLAKQGETAARARPDVYTWLRQMNLLPA